MTAETYAENDCFGNSPGLWEWLNDWPDPRIRRCSQPPTARRRARMLRRNGLGDRRHPGDPRPSGGGRRDRNYLLNQLLNPFGIPGGGINPAG